LGSITHIATSSGSVVQELSYDAWGRLRNPVTQQAYTPGSEPALFLGRGYTGHEHLPWFGLINMNARLYDPALGRFLSPDPFVQAPDFSQNFNRYSYCLNNPFRYTDPSGENPFLIALGIYVLFFTDFGYDVQKTFLPVAVKIDLRLGNHQGAIGIDASIGLPQALPISYRVHGGATYFWKNEDLMGNNMNGWETRYGAEWGIGLGPAFKITYGGTTFNSKWSGKQTTNLITVGNPLINLKYENDMKPEGLFKYIPFVPKGDGDRYRTAAAQLNFGPFGIGTKMMTGDPMENGTKPFANINGKDTYTGEHANDYRMGTFYFRIGPFRFGKNSENTRKIFQNQFAHDFLTGGQSYWFEVLNLKPRWYWGFGYSGGGTLW
jgi:RHS repeat-associated protein